MSTRITVILPSSRAFLGTAALALGLTVGFGIARAGVPADENALVYTGVLEEDGAVVDGQRAIAIEVFDVDVGGTALCRVAPGNVDVVAGRFRISLSDECAADIRDAGDTAFVDVRVNDVPVGARTRIGAVPFALEASAAAGTLATQLVPPGAVMAFDLAACPTGWSSLAAAANRVIVGSGALARGAVAGADSLTLSLAQMPQHDHGGATSSPSFQGGGWSNFLDFNVGGGEIGVQTRGDVLNGSRPLQEHAHAIAAAGGGAAFDNRQASLALLYCKKD